MGKGKGNRKAGVKGKGTSGARSARSGMGRDIAAVLVGASGAVLGLALLTFSASDGPLVAHGLPAGSNLAGPVGHHLATGFYRTLGFAALVVPVGLAVFAWRLFRGASPRITVLAGGAHVALALAVATLAHLALASRRLASFPAGGLVRRPLSTRA